MLLPPHGLDPDVWSLNIVEHSEYVDPQLPRRDFVGAEGFPIPCFDSWTYRELSLDRIHDQALLKLFEEPEVFDRVLREFDSSHGAESGVIVPHWDAA